MNDGVLEIGGIEVRYMPAASLLISKDLPYLDVFGLLEVISRLCFDPTTQSWDPMNMLFSGPKGTGKSLLLASYAKTMGIPYLSLDCSEETKERHIRGGFVAKAGTTPFILGTLANAIQVANEHGVAMLVFEEINALSPQMQKELNAITDFRKKVEMPELSWRLELQPGKKLFITGTMNPSVYGGTYDLNEDLKSRFVEFDVPYPPASAEEQILRTAVPAADHVPKDLLEKLIRIADESRKGVMQYALSPRDLVDILKCVVRVGWEEALFLALMKFNGADRKLMLDRIRDITKIELPDGLTAYAKARKLIL